MNDDTSRSEDDNHDISDAAHRIRVRTYKRCFPIFVVLFSVALGLFIGAFSRLEYYQIGFVRNKLSGKVDRTKVYDGGTYWLGVEKNFITFPSIAIQESLINLSVFTASTTENAGTTAYLDIYFQYTLREDELNDLYEATNLNYRSYIRNIAIDAIKNEAPLYSADQFLQERLQIEEQLKETLTSKLSEFYVVVIGMQLREISFPNEFYKNKLNAAIQDERNAEENYRKEATITRGETLKEVKFIDNDALLVEKNAQSQAALIRANATHYSTRIYEDSRIDSIQKFCAQLGINETAQILSIDMYFQLLDQQQNSVLVGASNPGVLISSS